MRSMEEIYSYSLDRLTEYMQDNRAKPYKAKQVYHWLYKKGVTSFKEMTGLSKDLIARLEEDFYIENLKLIEKQVASDGTSKFLFELVDGSLIESVLMVFDYGYSACISTQVGCNMACAFCASGLLKKKRDLTSGEILGQALWIESMLLEKGERLANIVVMEQGNPLITMIMSWQP